MTERRNSHQDEPPTRVARRGSGEGRDEVQSSGTKKKSVSSSSSGNTNKKKHHHKRGSFQSQTTDERQKTYGKQKDLFPELSSMPEFANYVLGDGDDASVGSVSTRYETKEDQDVAVFMALAGRMNIDSLLFILNGHAREMNLPSAEFLLPEKRQEREAYLQKLKKEFRWKEAADGSGEVALEIFDVEPYKECDLWWDDEFSQKILMGAIRDVRYYQANKQDFMVAVETLATQPDGRETEGHMKTLINDKHARGLEVHIVQYIEEIRKDFINAVLDEQDDCEDDGLDYFETADRLRTECLKYTALSQEFAYKLAKCDHIVALKASLSKWDKPKSAVSGKKKLVQKIHRSGSGVSANSDKQTKQAQQQQHQQLEVQAAT